MADMGQIHDFAEKWCEKFRDQNINYLELVDHYMADDCAALGFEMDCGNAFEHVYGGAVHNCDELDKVIDNVTDIQLLGSAIYSRWRYFNHWAYDGAEILEPKNRAWFILALSRLALLSVDNPFIFQGTLKKMRIVSNNICYGPMPEPDEEVEQHITINDEGRVWFSGYNYGRTGEKYKKARSKYFKIEKASAEKLLSTIAEYFSNEYIETFATDIGDWTMELTNTDGVTYRFRGSLCADFDVTGTDLSDLVRDIVGMDDLYVFDGNCKPDIINKITLDYHRVTKIKPKEVPEDSTWEFVTWDYTERLIIDRDTETLEHIQNIGTGCKVSRKYEVEGGIESLLENFDAEDLFSHSEGNPDDVIETPNETKDYTITIDYKKNPQRIITGSYDKNGLPEDFADFAETVFDFIRFYGMGEILDPSVYGKAKRRKSEYIFCSVSFDEGCKSYYYLTEDDSIEIGDFVLVPAGKDNHEVVVEVVNIEYFSEENAPLPIEKTKRIIRKCTDEDFDLPDE
ncbi:hypothetical protein [Pseudogracilibacillus sp. SO30301A]|uniref:hypothetical protein n=1 Tax=Pseudogracilibacillus sp. SO30301A TaxID=3098291 RepID=UPI00300E0CCB